MTTAQRLLLAALLTALLSSLVSSTSALTAAARAAEQGPAQASVASVRPTATGLQVEVAATALPFGTEIDLGSVRATVDGRPVDATATVRQAGAPQSTTRAVALVVDTSGSMTAARLAAARQAGEAYLAAVPDDVLVGLVTFSASPVVVAPPGADRRPVAAGLAALSAAGDTALHDAVLRALDLVAGAQERRLVVLSDGEDSASTASLEAVTAALRSRGVAADAVVLGEDPIAVATLQQMAAAGGGSVLTAGEGVDAATAFATAARAFDTTVLVDLPLAPAASDGPVPLSVQLTTSSGHVLAVERSVLLPDRPTTGGASVGAPALVVGLVALFTGLAAVLVLVVNAASRSTSDRRAVSSVLAAYTTVGPVANRPGEAVGGSRLGNGRLVRAALGLAERLVGRTALGPRLSARLDRAAVRLTAGEWVVVHATIAGLAVVVLLVLAPPVLVLLGTAVAAVAPHAWLVRKAERRQDGFVAAIPDSLQLVASGLHSGYSLPQALDSVVREGQEPVAGEFGRALAETRLGVPLETSLEHVAERMDSDDFRWVVMAIRVQREVGGNLSEVLETVCHTMRERASLRRQVRALSAEGRMSVVILVALPILVAVYLALASPDFFAPMLETSVGLGLLACCAVSLTLGALWMKKLVKVEM